MSKSFDDLFDKVLGSGGVEDNPIKMLAAILALKDMNENGATAVRMTISVGGDNVALKIGGRKDVIDALEIRDEVEQLSKDIQPIAQKYASAISEKYKAYIKKDPEEAAHKMVEWIVSERKL